MMKSNRIKKALLAVGLGLLGGSLHAAEGPVVDFNKEEGEGRLQITIGGKRFATYEYKDLERNRIYFKNVHTPDGIQVTVPQPLGPGDDDHGGYHPGVWISYGDINGNDYWRKGDNDSVQNRKIHDRFLRRPKGGAGRGSFKVLNRYLDGKDGPTVCYEAVEYTIGARPNGYFLLIDARYRAGNVDVVFGDQQEMGLGVRMNTPLNVSSDDGGRMLDSEGRLNEEEIWGLQGDWCDYRGPIKGKWAGITLIGHPENFRRSRFHARDYGCLLANPFGRAGFDQGEESKVVVKRGDTLRLRWGVFFHSSDEEGEFDPKEPYRDYLKLSAGGGE